VPLTEEQWMVLARDLRRTLGRIAPDWTGSNTHDPGVTVLEALAYTITDLHRRRHSFDERARGLARTVAELAGALAVPSAGGDDGSEGLQRVNYMVGMVLGVDDFRAGQEYVRQRLNRRNRLLVGTGIASGLQVTVERDTSGSRAVIAPGLAIDASGNEIVIDRPFTQALPAQGTPLFVLLRYAERLCRFVPVPSDPASTEEVMQATRIAETFHVELAPATTEDAVALVRLRLVRGQWRLDPTFRPAHLRG
jgi:hypothetical protein